MNREELADLWEGAIRPADKWLDDVPEWFSRDPVSLRLADLEVHTPVGCLPYGFGLEVGGRWNVYEDLAVWLRIYSGSNSAQLLRLCRSSLHDSPGWHGILVPPAAYDVHVNDPALVAVDLTRHRAVRLLCKAANIAIPTKSVPTLFPEDDDDQL